MLEHEVAMFSLHPQASDCAISLSSATTGALLSGTSPADFYHIPPENKARQGTRPVLLRVIAHGAVPVPPADNSWGVSGVAVMLVQGANTLSRVYGVAMPMEVAHSSSTAEYQNPDTTLEGARGLANAQVLANNTALALEKAVGQGVLGKGVTSVKLLGANVLGDPQTSHATMLRNMDGNLMSLFDPGFDGVWGLAMGHVIKPEGMGQRANNSIKFTGTQAAVLAGPWASSTVHERVRALLEALLQDPHDPALPDASNFYAVHVPWANISSTGTQGAVMFLEVLAVGVEGEAEGEPGEARIGQMSVETENFWLLTPTKKEGIDKNGETCEAVLLGTRKLKGSGGALPAPRAWSAHVAEYGCLSLIHI